MILCFFLSSNVKDSIHTSVAFSILIKESVLFPIPLLSPSVDNQCNFEILISCGKVLLTQGFVNSKQVIDPFVWPSFPCG